MILEVRGGCFSYGSTPILDRISFGLEDRKIMTILGPNGVGKTTLLKCVMDFLHWKSGETLVAGRPLKSYTDRELWQKISYVPQARRGVFSYRVLDMVVMGLNAGQRFFHTPGRESYNRARATLELLGRKSWPTAPVTGSPAASCRW